jgi:predicted dithiol-disulfide oxidoreductase (DUF899 family)
MTNTPMPEIVSAERWQQERADLLKAEKEATRALLSVFLRDGQDVYRTYG